MEIVIIIIAVFTDWTDRHKHATPMTTMTTETTAAMPTTAMISNPAFIHSRHSIYYTPCSIKTTTCIIYHSFAKL